LARPKLGSDWTLARSEVGRLSARALDAEDDIIWAQWRSVVEEGELRHDRQVGIDIQQCFVDLLGCRFVVLVSIRLRIHGRRRSVDPHKA
jgi:hypothetical protein